MSQCGQTWYKSRSRRTLTVSELALIHEILLTVPSQRETQLHLKVWGGVGSLKTCAQTSLASRCFSYAISYFWDYLDHLLCQNLGLSSPAVGLFRRVPSGPSSLRLSHLHDSDPDTSCTAAEQSGRPLCCHGFPPEC